MRVGKVVALLVILFVLILVSLLLPVIPFSVNAGPVGITQFCTTGLCVTNETVIISGTYALSCEIFGIGVLRVDNVIVGNTSAPQAFYAGWNNYCSNSQIAEGDYLLHTNVYPA